MRKPFQEMAGASAMLYQFKQMLSAQYVLKIGDGPIGDYVRNNGMSNWNVLLQKDICQRIEYVAPVAVMENVRIIISKKNIYTFRYSIFIMILIVCHIFFHVST